MKSACPWYVGLLIGTVCLAAQAQEAASPRQERPAPCASVVLRHCPAGGGAALALDADADDDEIVVSGQREHTPGVREVLERALGLRPAAGAMRTQTELSGARCTAFGAGGRRICTSVPGAPDRPGSSLVDWTF